MDNPLHHQLAARLAAAVYIENEADLRNELHRLGVCASTAKIIDGLGPLHERVLIVPTGGVVFVVVRGTINRAQWFSNGNFIKQDLPIEHGAMSHRGFYHGLMSVFDAAMEHLRIWRARRVVLVGHSRGAGMAINLALMLRMTGKRIEEIHLFGCPRTLNKAGALLFARYFPANCWNWVCNNDTVFRVPFRWMGFRHVGQIMYFDPNDRLHIDPSIRIKVRGQLLGRLAGGVFDGWSDHNAAREYKRLVGPLSLPLPTPMPSA